jgi:hypothetical protein
MPRAPELVRDHASPKRDLSHTLHDARELFRAVLGERSGYAGQAQDLAGRVDCYKRGREGLVAAQEIIHQGLGGSRVLSLPDEHPRTETEMKRHARAGIRTASGAAKRYGVALDQ